MPLTDKEKTASIQQIEVLERIAVALETLVERDRKDSIIQKNIQKTNNEDNNNKKHYDDPEGWRDTTKRNILKGGMLTWGKKYKGHLIGQIPSDYLLWMKNELELHPKAEEILDKEWDYRDSCNGHFKEGKENEQEEEDDIPF